MQYTWVDYLSALLTPTIALLGIYIAYFQYKINALRLKHELFERRIKVFEVVRDAIGMTLAHGNITNDEVAQYYLNTGNASFLFDSDICDYMNKVIKEMVTLQAVNIQLKGNVSREERTTLAKKRSDLLEWLYEQAKNCGKVFNKHLNLNKHR